MMYGIGTKGGTKKVCEGHLCNRVVGMNAWCMQDEEWKENRRAVSFELLRREKDEWHMWG